MTTTTDLEDIRKEIGDHARKIQTLLAAAGTAGTAGTAGASRGPPRRALMRAAL